MHKTSAHISVATESDIELSALFTLIEAHEEDWEASTSEPQIYETTIEYQHGGLDRRRIAGREYCTEAGTLSVFARGTRVMAEEIPAGQLNRVEYLRLRGNLPSAIEQALAVTPECPLLIPDAPVGLSIALARATKTVFQRPPNWPWVLVEVLAELTRTLVTIRGKAPLAAAGVADRIRTLVEEAPHHPWSVKELAGLCGMRREVLWETFGEQTGMSPSRWIRQHRIRVADTMLARGLSVRETAERLGFSSRQQFARTYRTVTGHAPSLRPESAC